MINTTRTIRLATSAPIIGGKQRYAVNRVSFIPADTPLKLADYFKIDGVFSVGSILDSPNPGYDKLETSVMGADFRGYVEVVFENSEDVVQSWHIDGHHFFVVGYVYFSDYNRGSLTPCSDSDDAALVYWSVGELIK